jgi:hypothetical protein
VKGAPAQRGRNDAAGQFSGYRLAAHQLGRRRPRLSPTVNDRIPNSRTRPRDPVAGVLRELRSAVRSHLVVLGTALAALEAVEGRSELLS